MSKKGQFEIEGSLQGTCPICSRTFKMKKTWERRDNRARYKPPTRVYFSGKCKCGFDAGYCLEFDCIGWPE